MPAVWKVIDGLGVNTVEMPVYWETLEPREGQFDYAQVDMLLAQARQHHKHLVLLWFGTWKNGSFGYTPQWIKLAPERFPLVLQPDGTALFSLSPFGQATLAADEHAFSMLMGHLKSADPQHTVLMVQVENETGVWGGTRDHSKPAEEAFAQPVPQVVLNAMGRTDAHGSWSQVFGRDADEYFCTWSIARYVEQVAKAGKTAYPLPMYVNAALRDPIHPGGQGSFESGAPTFDVLQLWHALTPSIDGIEPDIYMPQYPQVHAVLQQYALPWNAFFVPETGNQPIYAHYFFAALGAGAFGWSPFGMDATGYTNYPLGAAAMDAATLAPFAQNYAAVAPIASELPQWIAEGRVFGVAEDPASHRESIALPTTLPASAHWKPIVSYGLPSFYTTEQAPGNTTPDGKPLPEGEALIVALGPDEFLVTGFHCRIDFMPVPQGGQRMFLSVEEGRYRNGAWVRDRIWNGDQTDYGLNFTDIPQLLRVRLKTY